MKKETKTILIAVLIFVFLVGAAVTVYSLYKHDVFEGGKAITVLVKEGSDTKTFKIKTEGKYLLDALNEKKLVDGKSGAYGFFITAVDGRTANEDKQEWWQIVRNGTQTTTSADTTPIEDGDTIELVLSKFEK